MKSLFQEPLMKLIQESIIVNELKPMAEKMFEYLVKAVVDIEKEVMVVDAAFHADQEGFLLLEGSEQKNLWGINLHRDKYGEPDWIIFDSIINMRPGDNNRTCGVESLDTQEKILKIVNKLVKS
jgi:hypothetical protein